MYKGMKELWESCVVRREESDCAHWPECEECTLVVLHLIKLPSCWDTHTMDFACEDDRKQLAMLIHSHITGTCGMNCLFCEVERIPI